MMSGEQAGAATRIRASASLPRSANAGLTLSQYAGALGDCPLLLTVDSRREMLGMCCFVSDTSPTIGAPIGFILVDELST